MMSSSDLERLYEAHAQALFAFLLNLTRNEADTRDLLQETFARLAKDSSLLERVENERSFLLRTVHNLAIDLIRRRGSRSERQDKWSQDAVPIFAPSVDPDEEAFRRALSASMGELVEEQRTVVHLKLWEGLTFQQIAELLDIPANTAASRYRYGLDKLRERLRPIYDEIK
jgi:RNA polymerase sigma-70 factor (ECF subfamily)